jgi:anthranilate phosphoribosyltransferase
MKNFSAENFEEIFDHIIEQKIKDEDIKNFLLDLNDANLPTNAFIGAVKALKKRMKVVKAPENSIDVCGTGGDKLNSLNISTAVCFVVAAAGVVVAKHGNKAISSKSGSADIFSELGIKISNDVAEIERNLNEKKLCFLFAPFFHESLKNLAEIRKSLAVPTIFNFLGPLLNPANTRFQLIGVSRRDVIEKMAACLNLDDSKKVSSCIVHGFDGMDEITLTDKSYLFADEKLQVIDPENYGFKKVSIDDLRGGDPKFNAQKLVQLLQGEKSAYHDIVVLNSAFALKLVNRVQSVEEGINLAKNLILNGSANSVLERCRS